MSDWPPIVWGPDEIDGYMADAGDDIYLSVSPSLGDVKWQVGDRCSGFFIYSDTDTVEKAKRFAERALGAIHKVGTRYTLKPEFKSQAEAITWVEQEETP
jgi:hypothetical protein